MRAEVGICGFQLIRRPAEEDFILPDGVVLLSLFHRPQNSAVFDRDRNGAGNIAQRGNQLNLAVFEFRRKDRNRAVVAEKQDAADFLRRVKIDSGLQYPLVPADRQRIREVLKHLRKRDIDRNRVLQPRRDQIDRRSADCSGIIPCRHREFGNQYRAGGKFSRGNDPLRTGKLIRRNTLGRQCPNGFAAEIIELPGERQRRPDL